MSGTYMPTATANAPGKVRDRVLFVVVLTVFLDLVGFGITIPLLPFYVASMAPGNWAEVITGTLISSYSLAQALAGPWLGRLSDRYGRRSVILISLVGNVASMVVFALAVHWHILWLLFVSRIVAGATAGNIGACQAAIADVTTRQERGAAMGRLGAGIGLGMIVGPFIGGLSGKIADWAPPLAAAAMAFIDFVLAALLMPETRHLAEAGPAKTPDERAKSGPSLGDLVADRRIAAVIAMYFLTFMSMTSLNVAFPYLAKDRFHWTGVEVGYMFGVFGVTGVIIQGFLIKRLSQSFREVSLVMTAAVFMGTGLLVAAFCTRPWMLVAGNLFMGIGVAINNPSISTLASKLARPDQQGVVLGYAQSAGSWARTVWPFTWGFLYGHLAPVAPFLGAAMASMMLFGVALTLRRMAPPPVSLRGPEQADARNS
jgi:MFS transporter, DHA1 family, tetracycline resistance protein